MPKYELYTGKKRKKSYKFNRFQTEVFFLQGHINRILCYVNTPGQGQQEGNWTWLYFLNLLVINLNDISFHNSID